MPHISVTKLGTPNQLGYVVRDVEEQAAVWSKAYGVGPFFHTGEFEYPVDFQGSKSTLRLMAAFSYLGETQIQLIAQIGGSSSVFTELSVASPLGGLVHLGYFTSSASRDAKPFLQRGAQLVQRGIDAEGLETIYLRAPGHPGGLIELIDQTDRRLALKALMRQQSASWDGNYAFRPMSSLVLAVS
ncbi:hypothetical protein EN833_13485 [Mesorhizobium sp. M4B.F.Ca.ET.190.01.1.1]|uniref:VOC family protein n=1 Tax=unclassified Mesorhizobium TaxID=325217 RepID=UPI0010926A10|nr:MULTISPECIES: VOC family protein [unclassified Mesorhizobium]TGR10535.1 hypothetical protein EN843_13480 [Mesorhizobium sp. M4B.F.Ca.ET.200.01.1.1]TGS19625.1 hypothetical protein EN833_13485 [Mesorhizobium sp. M4B.F.Ca.ET.190.01.1.1]TGT32409.1 hypothetical protein EN815_07950 [Mesorhizobium sp. M4B.F.Ca.ET.172.01.1.1]